MCSKNLNILPKTLKPLKKIEVEPEKLAFPVEMNMNDDAERCAPTAETKRKCKENKKKKL